MALPIPEKMGRANEAAAKCCEQLSAEYISAAIAREVYSYRVPPGDFLDEPQDARGLPVGYGDGLGRNVRCDIFDYDSIPDVVVTNGHDDWAYKVKNRVLTA